MLIAHCERQTLFSINYPATQEETHKLVALEAVAGLVQVVLQILFYPYFPSEHLATHKLPYANPVTQVL